MKPLWAQRTTWLCASGIFAAGAALYKTGLTPEHCLTFLAVACGCVSSMTARAGAVQDAARLDAGPQGEPGREAGAQP